MGVGVLYDLAVAAHVLAVLGALVAIGVAGGFQLAVLAGAGGESVARYFRGGPSWGPRLLAPAGALGLIAAACSGGRVRLGAGWVVGAAILWLVAMAAVEALVRPAERIEPAGGAAVPTRTVAARGLAGAVIASGGVVAASVLMTVK